jgi:hypothetical protein
MIDENGRGNMEAHMNRNWKKPIFLAPLAILAMVLFTYIGGEIVMHLWNWLLPLLFGFRQVNFWEALGVLLLSRILFGGGLGGHYSRRSGWRRHMDERFEHMTPEERERFRQRMRERFGFGPSPTEPHQP